MMTWNVKTTALLSSLLLATSLLGCQSNDGGDKATSKDGSAAAKGDTAKAPKEGDSCKGMSATSGKIACDGNKVIFCSSFSKYKWKMQKECKDGTKCVASGKSASCK